MNPAANIGRFDPRTAHRLLLGAAATGLLHGAFSLYWAFGGKWLLDTVGSWATDLADEAPVTAGALLLVIAAIKIGGALCPLAYAAARLPGPAVLWQRMFLGGAVLLIVYGGLSALGAWAGIAIDGTFTASRLGHAALWDPLFLVWGLLLMFGIRALQRPPTT